MKRRALGGDVLERVDAERIAARNQQALVAPHEMDDALRARLEPRLILAKDFAAERAFGNVEASQLATILAQRHNAFEAADETHIELRPGPRAEEFAQLRKHQVVARKHGQRRIGLIEDFAELLLDLGGGALQMRRQPRVDALAQPQQLFAELCEFGAPAFLFADQRLTHALGPRRDQPPRLTVRNADQCGRLCQLAGILDRLQQRKKFGIDRLSRLVSGLPHQIKIESRTVIDHMLIFYILKGTLISL